MCFFFQAEDGIRDLVRSRGLGDVYKRQPYYLSGIKLTFPLSKKITLYTYLINGWQQIKDNNEKKSVGTQLEFKPNACLLYTSDAADERSSVDLGGRRIIKKKKRQKMSAAR